MTDVSDTSQRDRAICWVDVNGAAVRPASGSWLNRAEAEQTVKQLRGLIKSGYKTVGVVTPFTAQAKLIDQFATMQFGRDFLEDIGFVSGTAHRLQGDERDAILLSSVLSPGMSKSGARWIEKERNLLNVAVSRGRRALIVLGHPLIGDLGSKTLASLRAYLRDEVTRNEGAGSPSAEFRTDSMSEKLLLDAMQLRDLLPYAKLDVQGMNWTLHCWNKGSSWTSRLTAISTLTSEADNGARTLHETASWSISVGLSYGYRRGDATRRLTR